MVQIENLLILTEAIHVCVAVEYFSSILTLIFASSFLVTRWIPVFYVFIYSGCMVQASS